MEIIAHRGASHDAPENTLAAAALAWAQGADAIECDVHLTQDGHLAVLHDDSTARVAGIARAVSQTTLADLQQLEVGAWKGAKFAGERIPTLDALLATVPPGKRVFIELKDEAGSQAARALERCLARSRQRPEQIFTISFHLATAAAAKRLLPECRACWILEKNSPPGGWPLEALIQTCRDAGLDGLDLEAVWPLNSDNMNKIRGAGLRIYTWTVDDVAVARRWAALGVDGITTNRPGWLRAQLAP